MSDENNIITKINKKAFLLPKLLYVAISMFFYTFHSNKSKYIVETFKISLSKLGLWYVIPQVVAFLFGIKMGAVNDSLGAQRQILSITIFLGTFVFLLMIYIKRSFFLFMFLFIIYYSLISITLPLVDKITLDYLSNTENISISNYGSQRVFVPITYIILSFCVESIIKKESDGSNDYTLLSLFGLATGVMAFVAVFFIVPNLPRRQNSSHSFLSIFTLLKSFNYSFLMIIILLNGIVRAVLTNFLSVHFDQIMGFKNKYVENPNDYWLLKPILRNKIGSLALAGNLTEIPIFLFSSYIINCIGLLWSLLLAHLFTIIRLTGYYFVKETDENAFYYVFCLEMLKGLGFGLIQCSAVTLVNSLCQDNLKSTSQLLYNGIYISMSTAFSGLIFYRVLNTTEVASFRTVFLVSLVLIIISASMFIYQFGIRHNYLFDNDKFNAEINKIKNLEK